MTAVPPDREGAYGQGYEEDPYGVRGRRRGPGAGGVPPGTGGAPYAGHGRGDPGDPGGADHGHGAYAAGGDPLGTAGSSYAPDPSGRPDAARPPGPSAGPDPSGPGAARRFRESVDALADPLNDPLPGRHSAPVNPRQSPQGQQSPQSPQGQQSPQRDVSPWFRAHQAPAVPEENPAQARSQPPAYGQQFAQGHGYAEPVAPYAEPAAPYAEPAAYTEPAYGEPAAYDETAYGSSAYGSWGGGEHGGAPYDVLEAPGADAGATAALPAYPGDVADPPASVGEDAEEREETEDSEERAGSTAGERSGGRAERRRAAARARSGRGGRGSHGRGRGRGAPQPEEPARAPASRLEALRAKRARKDGPAIVASRFLGEVLITLGVLMLLFVVYQLWWTNVIAGGQAGGATRNLEDQWRHGGQGGHGRTDPERDPGGFAPGKGFAILWLPKLDVKAPIAQGVSKPQVLDKGMVGHYDSKPFKTAMPWDKHGNFALAGHRNTHGEPFRYVNRLVAGDEIVVETATKYYTYKMANRLPSTSPGNTGVIRPVPVGSGFRRAGRYITLTTCTPEFTSKYRLIVWGKMVDERPRSEGKPDALLK